MLISVPVNMEMKTSAAEATWNPARMVCPLQVFTRNSLKLFRCHTTIRMGIMTKTLRRLMICPMG